MVQLPALLPVGWVRPLEALSSVQARLHGTLENVFLTVVPCETRLRAVTLIAAGHMIEGFRQRYRRWNAN
jgi:hypothetical protein